MIDIIEKKIPAEALYQELSDPSCGGIVFFEGRVRNVNEGRPVVRLYYECYLPMAKKVMGRLAEQATSRWKIRKNIAVHRIGEIPIGETAVWIGVSAAHREEAFAACRFLIDEIKNTVPIWKKETYTDGSVAWAACHHS